MWDEFNTWHKTRYGWNLRDDRAQGSHDGYTGMVAWSAWREATARAKGPNSNHPAADGLADVLIAVFSEIEARYGDGDGNAPGHGHEIPGIWDSDNGDLAGQPCAWCALWNKAKSMLAATPSPEAGK